MKTFEIAHSWVLAAHAMARSIKRVHMIEADKQSEVVFTYNRLLDVLPTLPSSSENLPESLKVLK